MASLAPPRLAAPLPRPRDRLILFAVLGAGLASALLLLWALNDLLFAICFLAAFVGCAALILLFVQLRGGGGGIAADGAGDDVTLLKAAIDDGAQAIAITDRGGRLLCANRSYGEWFPGWPIPPELPLGPEAAEALLGAARAAWRDGSAMAAALSGDRGAFDAEVLRAGHGEDHLVWRLRRTESFDLSATARGLIEGEGGRRLGGAGVMAVLVDGRGRMLAATASSSSARSAAPMRRRSAATSSSCSPRAPTTSSGWPPRAMRPSRCVSSRSRSRSRMPAARRSS